MAQKPADSLGMFDQQRYKKITLNDKNGTRAGHLSPATTDGIANNAEAVLSFFHIPSETDVFFKAFITTFQESYTSDWNEEKVFGRTDGIYTFKNNTRRFTLAWKIPADTMGEAYENLAKVQRLAQFLYPTYAKLDEVRDVLSQSPLVRLKIMNLAQKTDALAAMDFSETAGQLFSSYTSTNDPSDGILGVINSLNINHNLENPAAGILQMKQNTILPKLIDVSIDFTVIHEETLGWTADKDSTFMDESFPYGARMEQEDPSIMKDQSYSEKIEARKAEERGRQQAEQDRANAEARGYDGMFGNRSRKKDAKRMGRMYDRAHDRAAKGKSTDRVVENYEYLWSAQQGYIAQGQTDQERQERTQEFYSDFIGD
jgi:hypothetical protein